MDHDGNTVASSNRHDADSFVGKNFSFRPYFKVAIRDEPASYLALGTTSGTSLSRPDCIWKEFRGQESGVRINHLKSVEPIIQ